MRACNQKRKALRAVLNRQAKRRIRIRKLQKQEKSEDSAKSMTRRVHAILNKIKSSKTSN